MPAKKIAPATIQTALDRWLEGEGRTEIIADLKLDMSYGDLGKLFREHSKKTWPELKAMRKGEPKTPKVAKKAKPEPKPAKAPKKDDKGTTEFTKAKAKKEATDAPQARRRAA